MCMPDVFTDCVCGKMMIGNHAATEYCSPFIDEIVKARTIKRSISDREVVEMDG